jgi:hypothetical protein
MHCRPVRGVGCGGVWRGEAGWCVCGVRLEKRGFYLIGAWIR